jgi:hypothetical protein
MFAFDIEENIRLANERSLNEKKEYLQQLESNNGKRRDQYSIDRVTGEINNYKYVYYIASDVEITMEQIESFINDKNQVLLKLGAKSYNLFIDKYGFKQR